MRRLFSLAVAWLLLLPRVCSAAEADGPYVVRNAAGTLEAWSVQVTADGARKQVLRVAPGTRLTVAAVGSLPAFEVTLRAPAEPAPDDVADGDPRSLFVVADTHGEYPILAGMLMKQGVIDEALHWKFGRGRLVFLGDVSAEVQRRQDPHAAGDNAPGADQVHQADLGDVKEEQRDPAGREAREAADE